MKALAGVQGQALPTPSTGAAQSRKGSSRIYVICYAVHTSPAPLHVKGFVAGMGVGWVTLLSKLGPSLRLGPASLAATPGGSTGLPAQKGSPRFG